MLKGGRREEFKKDGINCRKVPHGASKMDEMLVEFWLPLSDNEIEEAFGKITQQMKEKAGIIDSSCVKHFQEFIERARKNKRN